MAEFHKKSLFLEKILSFLGAACNILFQIFREGYYCFEILVLANMNIFGVDFVQKSVNDIVDKSVFL